MCKLFNLKMTIKALEDNIQLKKEKDKLEMEVYETHQRYEKYKNSLENKYKKMDKRNEVLSKDNRKLIAIGRKKDKEIIELKRKVKELENEKTNV